LIEKAEDYLKKGWPAFPATLFLDCKRTGNRERGEAVHFGRRQHLAFVTLAYVVTREPRWLDAALDALWSLAEESTWCVPAHSAHHPSPDRKMGLPRHDLPVVDLFAAETGAIVADALDLLREDLNEIDTAIVPRLIHELQVRIVDPVTEREDWWWLSGKNNWTPWVISNTSRVVLAHSRDRQGMESVIRRYLASSDKFLSNYGPDGGCDEGMRYWGVAFGTLFLFLEALHHSSKGKISLFDHPQFKALGTFPVHAHLGTRWFLPFADNLGTGGVRRALGWRVGERLKLPALQEIAWLECRDFDLQKPAPPLQPGATGSSLQDLLWQLFWMPPDAPRPQAPAAAAKSWLPDLQVLVVRSPGLVMAVKGGHNEENHNHNDVGSLHVLKNGKPVVIDPGVETYSMRTFSHERYEIWSIRGSGHNAPVINGFEQLFGRQYEAREVAVKTEGEIEIFQAELSKCYSADAGLSRVLRTVKFDRTGQKILVSDEIEGKGVLNIETVWYSTQDPRSGLYQIESPGATVHVEEFPLEDPLLRESWQTDRLWKIRSQVSGRDAVTVQTVIQ
jgi:hypothetical protein